MNFEQKKVKGVILGDCSYDDIKIFKYHNNKYRVNPKIDNLTNEMLFGRKEMLQYFQKEFDTNLK